MAVLSSKAAGAGKAAAGARFRQRKISVKISLPIYNGNEISATDQDLEPSQLHHLNAAAQQSRELHHVETGVDKNEEDEVHLQQVINAAQRVLLGSNKEIEKGKEPSSVYIPTPDASKIWPDAKKYYSDELFVEPESYIKFSATVEDTLGIEYNMDEIDEKFFEEVLSTHYPKATSEKDLKNSNEVGNVLTEKSDAKRCTMLEFEAICDKFEKKIEERQPFLSMDPSNILLFAELSSLIIEEFNSSATSNFTGGQTGVDQKYISTSTLKEKLSKELGFLPFVTTFDKNQKTTNGTRSIPRLLKLFGEPIYTHWKNRKLARKGKSITPALKFEDPNANEKDNDNDPYVCFRRREFRQARKTRRADNLGAERIRMLQKSLRSARDIIFDVCKREMLKLEAWEADHDIFRLRMDAKGVKRSVGIKGDDHLFYPHKRKKILRIEQDDDDEVDIARSKKDKRKNQESSSFPHPKDSGNLTSQAQPEASSTQPYVKLPPSKIPDMDLVTVSCVINEKTEAIKRAVVEKLKKRNEHDKGFVNITYDPHQPFFNISTNKGNKLLELSHIPYSSIASSHIHQFNTTNVIRDQLSKVLEDDTKPFPGMKSFSGSSGELVPSEGFPQLHSLLTNHLSKRIDDSSNYVSRLLSSVEKNDFSSYTNGFGKEKNFIGDTERSEASEPIFRLRKRIGRSNQSFVDRRGLSKRPMEIDGWFTLEDNEANSFPENSGSSGQNTEKDYCRDPYHNRKDIVSRMDSRWKFDDDYSGYERGLHEPFSLSPSKLNSISDDTQSIRFGSMLLSKSYDLLRESAHQRQVLIQQAKIRALQQHQVQRSQPQMPIQSISSGSQQSASNGASSNGSGSKPANGSSGVALPPNTLYRKTPSQGAYASSSSKLGSSVNRAHASYTAQQLLAMQQYKHHNQQNNSLPSPFAQKKSSSTAGASRTTAASAAPKTAQHNSSNLKSAGDLTK